MAVSRGPDRAPLCPHCGMSLVTDSNRIHIATGDVVVPGHAPPRRALSTARHRPAPEPGHPTITAPIKEHFMADMIPDEAVQVVRQSNE